MPSPTIMLAAAAWRFEHPSALLLLFLVPVVVLVLAYSAARSRRSLLLITGITPNQPRASGARQAIRVVLTAAGISSLIIAIARPQSDPVEETVTVRGRDIVFVVDVSRSMLSRDVVPDRLGRTKIWINDLVNTLKGDRVALVAFAGVPVVKCPLTLDQSFFRMELDELSPASVPRGGTLIGDAIRKTMSAVFEPNPGRFRDIVLITDGEDQGSFPTEAAKAAAELGVRIIAIGIGSELEGAQVPADGKDGFLVHEGTTVRSKMDGTTLAAIAQAASSVPGNGAGGVFLNVGTGTMDLDKVYHDLIASAEQRETDSKASITYKELFPMFLAAALALLSLDSLLPVASRAGRPALSKVSKSAAALVAVLAALVLPTRWAVAQQEAPAAAQAGGTTKPEVVETSPAALYNAGREFYQKGDFAQAVDRFRAADLAATDSKLSAQTRFNLGMALLRQATAKPAPSAPNAAQGEAQAAAPDGKAVLEQLEGSVRAFRSALAVDPADEQAMRNVEIARRLMQQIKDEQAKQEQQEGKDGQKSESKDKSGSKDKGDSSKQDQKQESESAKDQEAKQHQEQADKLKELAKQQSQAAEKSKQASEEQDAQKAKDASDASRQQQQDVNQKTQAQQEQMKKDAPQEGGSKEALDKARKEQDAASKALEGNDPKTAQQHQEEAAKSLEQAAQAEEKAAQEAREQAAQERQNQQAQKEAKDQAKQDKPKYDQSASQALDKERKQRDARQQMLRALRGRPVPVEKDW